jgi:hypothetical protein
MADENETVTTAEDAEATEGAAAPAKSKRASEKGKRSHGDRAMASLRAAKRGQREVSDPTERAQFLLAEANVLALLDVADALAGRNGTDD